MHAQKYLTFRDVKVDDTLQDSHVTTATTSWLWVKVQNLLSDFTHYRKTEEQKRYSILDSESNNSTTKKNLLTK